MGQERTIHGVVASVGTAIGKAVRTFDPLIVSFNFKLRPDQVRKEVERFRGSVEKSREQLKRMQSELRKKSGPESSFLIDAHLLVLQDRLFVDRIIEKIEADYINSENDRAFATGTVLPPGASTVDQASTRSGQIGRAHV